MRDGGQTDNAFRELVDALDRGGGGKGGGRRGGGGKGPGPGGAGDGDDAFERFARRLARWLDDWFVGVEEKHVENTTGTVALLVSHIRQREIEHLVLAGRVERLERELATLKGRADVADLKGG